MKSVIIRLPLFLLNALTTLFLEFGSGLPLSLMSQYHPVFPQKDQALNRFLTQEEFDQAFSHATDMGFACREPLARP
jgi:putative pyruvate formate lyase activating enzyme